MQGEGVVLENLPKGREGCTILTILCGEETNPYFLEAMLNATQRSVERLTISLEPGDGVDFTEMMLPKMYDSLEEIDTNALEFTPSFCAWINHFYEGINPKRLKSLSLVFKNEMDWKLIGENREMEIARKGRENMLKLITNPNLTVLDLFFENVDVDYANWQGLDMLPTIEGFFNCWRKFNFIKNSSARCVYIRLFQMVESQMGDETDIFRILKIVFEDSKELFENQKNCILVLISLNEWQNEKVEKSSEFSYLRRKWKKALRETEGNAVHELFETKNEKEVKKLRYFSEKRVRAWKNYEE